MDQALSSAATSMDVGTQMRVAAKKYHDSAAGQISWDQVGRRGRAVCLHLLKAIGIGLGFWLFVTLSFLAMVIVAAYWLNNPV